MIKNKKGAELSLNVIIIAIIVIIVLVVVIVIFGTKLNLFGKTSDSCESQKGNCEAGIKKSSGTYSYLECPEGKTRLRTASCNEDVYGKDYVCCISVLG